MLNKFYNRWFLPFLIFDLNFTTKKSYHEVNYSTDDLLNLFDCDL